MMEQEFDFWNQFHPHVWMITKRDASYWKEMDFEFGEHINIHKLSFFYSGEGQVVYNDVEKPLLPGMFVYSHPGNWVQFRSSRHDPLQFYSVMFDFALVSWEGRSAFRLEQKQPERKLPLPDIFQLKQTNLAAALMPQLHACWKSKKVGYEWKVKYTFLSVIAEIVSQQIRTKGDDANMEMVNKVIAYINEHYAEPIDRGTLADYVALSHSHLSYLFKTYTGWSPVQYIIKIRMDKAKELLRDTRKTIQAIANEVGYSDPLYFSRLFAKHTGMSPRKYRNS